MLTADSGSSSERNGPGKRKREKAMVVDEATGGEGETACTSLLFCHLYGGVPAHSLLSAKTGKVARQRVCQARWKA